MENNDDEFLQRILWTNEPKLRINDSVNRHNCVYWCKNNHYITSNKAVNSPDVMVLCSIHIKGSIGPFCFNENVSSDTSLKMFRKYSGDHK